MCGELNNQEWGISHEVLFRALATCASLIDVHQEVIINYDDNKWWPVSIEDWRLRMVIAGWSSRISYNMISTYQKVIQNVKRIGYDLLCIMPEEELHNLISPLGLFHVRNQYLKSITKFIEEFGGGNRYLAEIPNDMLIEVIAKKVRGASYKIAQCAVLYARGYHCGVFPVDSGMKDILGPCLGFQLPKGAIAHEVMRRQVEKILITYAREYHQLAIKTGYESLAISKNKPPIWWAHLVFVYFKRLYCNKRKPWQCPLRNHSMISHCMGTMCDRAAPQLGGYY